MSTADDETGITAEDSAVAPRNLIAEKAELLPQRPGVYLFKDKRGKVIYVGKAKSLRERVRSYLSAGDGRYTVASGATGVIRAARDASVAYANTREVQGQTIANFQLVKQKIANMEADYQMAHLLWLKTGYLKKYGIAVGKGGEPR